MPAGDTSVSSRANALRWTAAPAEAHLDLGSLLVDLALAADSELSRLPLRLTPTAVAGAEPAHSSSQQ